MNADKGRILILGDYPPPFGGIATHLRGLVPALEQAGYGMDVVSPGAREGVETISELSVVHRISKDRFPNIQRIGRRPLGFLGYAASARLLSPQLPKAFVIAEVARAALAARRSEFRLIAAYMVYPWGFAGAMLAGEFRLPLVTTNFGELYQSRRFYLKNRHVAERVVQRSSALLASSEHCARMYERVLGMRGVAVRAIPYGVEARFFDTDLSRADARRALGIPDDGTVVLFVGRMNSEMGVDTLLGSVSSLAVRADLLFLIVGATGDLTPGALALQAAFPGRVMVRTDVPFTDLPRYYSAADLVVAPSADERTCMGIAIKEAMARSRMVIATTVGGIGEAVIDGETGLLVPPRDPEALASAIERVAADPARLADMGRYGRERAERLFTMDGTHQRVISVMEAAMRPTRASLGSA